MRNWFGSWPNLKGEMPLVQGMCAFAELVLMSTPDFGYFVN